MSDANSHVPPIHGWGRLLMVQCSILLIPLLCISCGNQSGSSRDNPGTVYLTGPNTHQQSEENMETRYIPTPEEIARRGISEIRLSITEKNGVPMDADPNYAYIYRFDRNGRITSAGIPEYPSLSFAYDDLGRITRSSVDVKVLDSGPNRGDTARMSILYHYDGAPDTIRETSDYSRYPVFHIYDSESKRRLKSYGGSGGDTTFYHYSDDGQLLKKLTYRDGKGLLYGTIYEFDDDGHLQRELSLDGQGLSDSAVQFVTTYTYDDEGRLVGESSEALILGRETMAEYRYEWDESGLLSRVMESHPSSGRGSLWMRVEYRYFSE